MSSRSTTRCFRARVAARGVPISDLSSIGLDTWGVDYGLVDAGGRLLGNPYHYRDGRTAAGVEAVHAVIPRERLYFQRNGLQSMAFNTVYQLAASRGADGITFASRPRRCSWMPDLLAYWLTGVAGAEETIASTTGLLRGRRPTWDVDLVDELDLPRSIPVPRAATPGRCPGRPPSGGGTDETGLLTRSG